LDISAFEAKYGFEKPAKNIGNHLVVTCRSGRRVKLAISELEQLGYENLTYVFFPHVYRAQGHRVSKKMEDQVTEY
jgi:rhodanese-related sulfurtransferase